MKINRILTEASIEQAAKEFGSEVKKAAQAIEAGEVITEEEPLGVIGEVLDDALEAAEEAKDFGMVSGVNVLLVGRGGTGKTSIVKRWAQLRGVNFVEKDAKTLDPSDLGGIVGRQYDEEGNPTNTVTKLSNHEFDELDKPNSVLFLDELNRAPQDVAGSLLTLINDHVVNDQEDPSGKRLLKGFLFTIAAINPPRPGNEVNELDNPMRSRFRTVDVESDKNQMLKYFTFRFNKDMKQMEEAGKTNRIPAIAGRLAIATKLLKDPRFEFDGDEEEDEAQFNGYPVLNPRSLTNLLMASQGKKEKFINMWSGFCNPRMQNLIEDILEDYVDVDDKANSVFSNDPELNPFAAAKEARKKEQNIYDQIGNLF